MYLSEYFLYCAPLILYAGWRLWTLVGSKILKPVAILLFGLLVASYPFAERISRGFSGETKRIIAYIAYVGLPALLYLVLAVLAVDLLVGAGRLAKLLSRERVRSSRFRRLRLAATLLVPAAIVVGGIANFRTIRIKEYAVEVPRRSSALDGLTIAFAADFHLGLITAPGFTEKFAAKVNELQPDIVLIGGDVFEGHGGEDRTAEFEAGFKRLQARFGVYAVPGNHEGFGSKRDAFFAQAGIVLLRDVIVKIDDAFTLIGRNDGRRGRKPIGELLQETTPDLPIILLDHRPGEIEAVSRTGGVDIQLSGHTHNGQIFPANIVTRRQYLLNWGHMKKGRTDFFVTSGVQGWGPPVRTAGRSEILLIRVRFRG